MMQVIKSQKKFRMFKNDNPCYFLQTFDYNEKTHYLLSSSSYIYIGYMEKSNFNQIINYSVSTYVTSFHMCDNTLYFGLKNGSIIFSSLQQVYNQIPFKAVESVDGASILGIFVEQTKQNQKRLYTISQNSYLRLYEQAKQTFKMSKNIKINFIIEQVASKNLSSALKLPIFMLYLKGQNSYPLLLTLYELIDLINEKTTFENLIQLREKYYFHDERLVSNLTSIDYDPYKMIAAIGYLNGLIDVLTISTITQGQRQYYLMTHDLRVQQRVNVRSVSINPYPNCNYIAFVTEQNFSGFNYEKRSSPFGKIKIEKDKEITVSKWTIKNYFISASISTENHKIKPKVYCIEQDIQNES